VVRSGLLTHFKGLAVWSLLAYLLWRFGRARSPLRRRAPLPKGVRRRLSDEEEWPREEECEWRTGPAPLRTGLLARRCAAAVCAAPPLPLGAAVQEEGPCARVVVRARSPALTDVVQDQEAQWPRAAVQGVACRCARRPDDGTGRRHLSSTLHARAVQQFSTARTLSLTRAHARARFYILRVHVHPREMRVSHL